MSARAAKLEKEETNLVGEMVCDLGMKCWKRRTERQAVDTMMPVHENVLL